MKRLQKMWKREDVLFYCEHHCEQFCSEKIIILGNQDHDDGGGNRDDVTEIDNMIALTIDDAPLECCDSILDVLKENDCRATFFIISEHVRRMDAQNPGRPFG